jgi:integrase
MAIIKNKTGWQVDVRPNGRSGKRVRKTFKRKADAVQFERSALVGLENSKFGPETGLDKRRLSDLIKLWFDHHGVSLKSAGDTYKRLLAIAETINDPSALSFTPETWAEYRTVRLSKGVSASTLNREQATLAAVFSELSRLGKWNGGNPLAQVRKLRVDDRELSYLTLQQIETLLREVSGSRNADLLAVVRICLSTGCRWSEAEGLRVSDVCLEPAYITFAGTKSGRVRVIPVASSLMHEVLEGRPRVGRLFGSCYAGFRKAVERAKIELPDGQLAHVLRHTFASHYMMSGGSILALQRILGHSDLKVTMRYAHLAPDHLRDILHFNPLAKFCETGRFNIPHVHEDESSFL